MPYNRNSELPKSVSGKIKSGRGQTMFRRVVNAQLLRGVSEAIAFASAWSALKNAGYKKNDEGQWIKKSASALRAKVKEHNEEHSGKGRVTLPMLQAVYDRGIGAYRTNPSSVRPNVSSPEQWAMARVNNFLRTIRTGRFKSGKHDTDLLPKVHPMSTRKANGPTLSSVHVPSTERRERKEKAEITFKAPKGAQNAARRALRWKEKYGDEVKGGTQVGWTRANQLASGQNLSRSTVGRMASFNRHRKNAVVDPKYKSTPWKDRGHVAWLLWGGNAGVNWAMKTMDRINKHATGVDQYTTREEAEARSRAMGLGGDIHSHDTENGPVCMPAATHEEYQRHVEERKGLQKSDERAILETVDLGKSDVSEHITIGAEIIKSDTERRIVWGWASVISENGDPIVDTQGDYIPAEEMEKMADQFMTDVRVAKAMHRGSQIGEVIHSFPMTKEIAKAFDLDSKYEGWIIGMKVHDDEMWAKVKSGEYGAFSIGGKGERHDN